jgi:hypothetical protein
MSTFRITFMVELPEDMTTDDGDPAVYGLTGELEQAAQQWWTGTLASREEDSDLEISQIKIEQQHIRWEELP